MPREINHLAVLGPEVLAGLGVASYESVELPLGLQREVAQLVFGFGSRCTTRP